MINLNISLPEEVAAEFYAAADQLNRRLPSASPRIDAKSLMAFALARFECPDICGHFDLALRLVAQTPAPPFNPVLTDEFLGDDRPMPPQPASHPEAA